MTANSRSLEQNDLLKARVEQAYAGFSAGDMDAFFRLLSFRFDAILVEPEGLPYGGTYRGPVAIREGIEAAMATWADGHVEIEKVAAADNLVFVYMHAFCQGKTSGMSFAHPLVEVLRFEGEDCLELRPFHFDTVRLAAVLGR